jgi:hypothetical protein
VSEARSYWALAYHPARAFWLARGLCLLLALDSLLLMIEHAGRYGVGGFNVAHFRWLDALAPHASPAPYLTLLSSAALLALAGVVRPLSRAAQVALLVAYTAAWAMSQHDSYQHHYLISWLLAWMLWLPRARLAESRDPNARTSGAGLALTATTCAIVYAFTAVSKSEAAWQSGAVLRRLAGTPGPFALLTRLDVGLAAGGSVLRGAAAGVLLLQVAIALAYALAPLRDQAEWARVGARRTAALRLLCAVGWLFSTGFHLATELQASFAIGWFSYYMLWIAAVLFTPSAWLVRLSDHSARLAERAFPLPLTARTCLVLLALVLLAGLWLIGRADLPGIPLAVVSVGLPYLTAACWCLRRGTLRDATDHTLSIVLSLGLTLACLELGHIRFDYHRRLAGELLRMGRLEDALEQYRKTDHYAPRGKSRREVIERIERQLSEQRGQRHRQL